MQTIIGLLAWKMRLLMANFNKELASQLRLKAANRCRGLAETGC